MERDTRRPVVGGRRCTVFWLDRLWRAEAFLCFLLVSLPFLLIFCILERETEEGFFSILVLRRALHIVVRFRVFLGHGFRDICVLGAARRFFYSVPFRRSSVYELSRPTPISDFDDFCAGVFLTGRDSFSVLTVFLDSALFGTFPEVF